MSVEFLERTNGPALAYQRTRGENVGLPTVLFLHGLWSDMEGTKAQFLEQACAKRGQSFIRFDCRGHGKSEGVFEDSTIGDWLDDALYIVDTQTGSDPLILVGSSMGGWLSLLVAIARPDRISALIGLAAAPDFTRNIKKDMTEDQSDELNRTGHFYLSGRNTDFPCVITQKLLEEGEEHCLLREPINIGCPVIMVQGMKDDSVPWQTAHRIVNAITGADKQVYLQEESDHRLSSAQDLALLEKLLWDISAE